MNASVKKTKKGKIPKPSVKNLKRGIVGIKWNMEYPLLVLQSLIKEASTTERALKVDGSRHFYRIAQEGTEVGSVIPAKDIVYYATESFLTFALIKDVKLGMKNGSMSKSQGNMMIENITEGKHKAIMNETIAEECGDKVELTEEEVLSQMVDLIKGSGGDMVFISIPFEGELKSGFPEGPFCKDHLGNELFVGDEYYWALEKGGIVSKVSGGTIRTRKDGPPITTKPGKMPFGNLTYFKNKEDRDNYVKELNLKNESLEKLHVITEDGIKVYEGDLVWAIGECDTVDNLTEDDYIELNKDSIELYSTKRGLGKLFNSKESAKKYIQKRDWKEGDLYFVQVRNGGAWEMRYSSATFSRFFIFQRQKGNTSSSWHKFIKCPEGFELPK